MQYPISGIKEFQMLFTILILYVNPTIMICARIILFFSKGGDKNLYSHNFVQYALSDPTELKS
jgi:hypothetical protein